MYHIIPSCCNNTNSGFCSETGKTRCITVHDLWHTFISCLPTLDWLFSWRPFPSQVFDCWFESGSMPYAQLHYPFENKEKFERNFPADFIAEGLDQVRHSRSDSLVFRQFVFDTLGLYRRCLLSNRNVFLPVGTATWLNNG